MSKICKDCKFYIVPSNGKNEEPLCAKTKSISIITGEPSYFPCYMERYESDKCGMDAKWFEPK